MSISQDTNGVERNVKESNDIAAQSIGKKRKEDKDRTVTMTQILDELGERIPQNAQGGSIGSKWVKKKKAIT